MQHNLYHTWVAERSKAPASWLREQGHGFETLQNHFLHIICFFITQCIANFSTPNKLSYIGKTFILDKCAYLRFFSSLPKVFLVFMKNTIVITKIIIFVMRSKQVDNFFLCKINILILPFICDLVLYFLMQLVVSLHLTNYGCIC